KVLNAQSKDSNFLHGEFCGLNSNGNPAPILKFAKNGRIFLAWADSKLNSYVSELSAEFKIKTKSLIKIPGHIIYDMTFTKSGIAIIYVSAFFDNQGVYRQKPSLYLAKYSYSGSKSFQTLVTGVPRDYKNWRVADQGWNVGGLANLHWTGNLYAVYANTNRKWEDNVIHQGDLLHFYNKKGRKVKGGFSWGNSHSFRPLLAYNGKYIITATTGDGSPRALNVSIINSRKLTDYKAHKHKIQLIKASGRGGANDSHNSSGGLLANKKSFLFAFDSKEKRSSYDIGFFKVNIKTGKFKKYWLTKTRNIQERISKIIRYGKNYLILWGQIKSDIKSGKWLSQKNTSLMAKVVTSKGKTIVKSQQLLYNFRGATKIFNYPNGDIGWINDSYSLNAFEPIRLKVPK
ncbi:MAG: hypothetical protein OEZ36_13890, partial [Spirochaetota bacterium]|nr:hypothetical protein [Spirochaetota bacterium]